MQYVQHKTTLCLSGLMMTDSCSWMARPPLGSLRTGLMMSFSRTMAFGQITTDLLDIVQGTGLGGGGGGWLQRLHYGEELWSEKGLQLKMVTVNHLPPGPGDLEAPHIHHSSRNHGKGNFLNKNISFVANCYEPPHQASNDPLHILLWVMTSTPMSHHIYSSQWALHQLANAYSHGAILSPSGDV